MINLKPTPIAAIPTDLVGAEIFPGSTRTQLDERALLNIELIQIVPLAETALIVPHESADLFVRIDDFIAQNLDRIAQTYTLVHPAYVNSAHTHTNVFEKLLGEPNIGDGDVLRFDGAHLKDTTVAFYNPRPLHVELCRNEQGSWSVHTDANYMLSYPKNYREQFVEADRIDAILERSGIKLADIGDDSDILINEDYTCVVQK